MRSSADPDSVERAAQAKRRSPRRSGHVHIVCNNAGVGGGSGIDTISVETWRWVVDVNLMGVVHGIRTFLPHIRAHGEGGHFVNTASMAGLNSGLRVQSVFLQRKFAVVNISEGLSAQLAPFGIGVSVVCPGFVRTRISESGRNRPETLCRPAHRYADPRQRGGGDWQAERWRAAKPGPGSITAEVAGARWSAAVRAGELYVFTHADGPWREEVAARFETILAAMDKAAASPNGER